MKLNNETIRVQIMTKTIMKNKKNKDTLEYQCETMQSLK